MAVEDLLKELFFNPINLALLSVCGFLLYKIFAGSRRKPEPPRDPPLPKMKKRDFNLQDLKEYDGTGPEKRVLGMEGSDALTISQGHALQGRPNVLRTNG